MIWFKNKYSVCKECGVHFEPVTGYESTWGDLCSVHRKAVRDRDEKKDSALEWARINWEKVYEMSIKEKDDALLAQKEYLSRMMESLQADDRQRQAYNQRGLASGGLGNMFGGG